MRVFILEDDWTRIARFREWFDGHDITQVDSCLSVDAFQPPYDVIFLDHDLGGRQLEEHEDCGHTFAKLIEPKLVQYRESVHQQQGIFKRPIIVVHSFSPDGARNIYHELQSSGTECYIAPFLGLGFKAIVSALLGRQILR